MSLEHTYNIYELNNADRKLIKAIINYLIRHNNRYSLLRKPYQKLNISNVKITKRYRTNNVIINWTLNAKINGVFIDCILYEHDRYYQLRQLNFNQISKTKEIKISVNADFFGNTFKRDGEYELITIFFNFKVYKPKQLNRQRLREFIIANQVLDNLRKLVSSEIK